MPLDPRITFSRASLATCYGSDGLLKYAPHNWVFPSQALTVGMVANGTLVINATTAPDGTTTANQLVQPSTPGRGVNVQYTSTGLGTAPQIVSVYAKANTKIWLMIGDSTAGGTVNAWFNLSTGVVGSRGGNWLAHGIDSVGSGWYRCWARSSTAGSIFIIRASDGDTSRDCASAGDLYVWGAQAEWITAETAPRPYLVTTSTAYHGPRFDYDPVSHAAKGLLIEEARTNAATYSQDFSNAIWTKTGITVTADSIAAPDGTTSADLVTTSATPATVSQATAFSGSYAISFFAKKGTSDWVYVVGQAADSAKAWFNLNTGVVGTVQAGLTAGQIQDVGNGWYRCIIIDVSGSGAEPTTVGLSDADNSTAVTVGRTAYIWGAQAEGPATFASSYIPNPTAATARAADVAVMTGTNFSSWYNQSQGTLVAEFDVLVPIGASVAVSADDGSVAEQIILYGSGTDPKVMVRDGNVTQADLDVGTFAANVAVKIGASYALNDVAGCCNGGSVGTDTSATMPTPTQLRFGFDVSGVSYLNGHIRHIQFQNTALTDAELITLTTPGPWPGGEPVPGRETQGSGAMGAFFAQDNDYDPREVESSRKRRKRFLDERARRIAEL
jgi:hypothetical protein